MTITMVCPDCHRAHGTSEVWADRKGEDTLTICCLACHAVRRARLSEMNARYPSASDLGLVGSTTDIPTGRYHRPHARGRRVMNKEERQGG